MSEHSWDKNPEADLFNVLMQGLFVPEGEVDQDLSQTPTDFNLDFGTLLDRVDAQLEQEGVEKAQCDNKEQDARFSPRVTSSQIRALQEMAIPTNMKNNTNLAINIWEEWSAH